MLRDSPTCDIDDNRPQAIVLPPVVLGNVHVQPVPGLLAVGYTPDHACRAEVEDDHLHRSRPSQVLAVARDAAHPLHLLVSVLEASAVLPATQALA